MFGDRDECANSIGHDVVAALSDENCPSGIDPDRLAACVTQVQTNACDDGSEPEARLPLCARERLCNSGPSVPARAAQTDW
jgi:hypothetical protein